jgi:DEAD/DEAH box helicase domain-containing protein
LTKATGRTTLPLQSFRAIIPVDKRCVLNDIPELSKRGVLYLDVPENLQSKLQEILSGNNSENDSKVMIGFPLPSDHFAAGGLASNAKKQKHVGGHLHGSTKAAAKRRLSALKKSFQTSKTSKPSPKSASNKANADEILAFDCPLQNTGSSRSLDRNGIADSDKYQEYSVKEQHDRLRKSQIGSENELSQEAKNALHELEKFFDRGGGKDKAAKVSNNFILPKQAAYAGSKKERQTAYSFLTQQYIDAFPVAIRDAFGLQLTEDGTVEDQSVAYQALDAHKGSTARRKLYSHQAEAIKASLDDTHTLVCTGTGSGKSLCFLLPILARVMKSDAGTFTGIDNSDQTSGASSVALLIFPTKALANDQLTKLNSIIKKHPLMEKHIRAGIIDGDTPHQSRGDIANQCNILLSNPDTLHAAILPGWKTTYKNFLARLNYIVIDELHIYEGAFGAHVSLVLSRLLRLVKVANCVSENPLPENKLIFIGCSATIGHPEDHFRLICPIAKNEKIKVLTADEDGSPCAAKVRILDMNSDNFVITVIIIIKDISTNSTFSCGILRYYRETESVKLLK